MSKKLTMEEIKRMEPTEVNERWDEVCDTLRRGYDQPAPADDTEGDDDDE